MAKVAGEDSKWHLEMIRLFADGLKGSWLILGFGVVGWESGAERTMAAPERKIIQHALTAMETPPPRKPKMSLKAS